jgi:hypothetical protein
VTPSFKSVLDSTGIRFVQAEVEGVDLSSRKVALKPLGVSAYLHSPHSRKDRGRRFAAGAQERISASRSGIFLGRAGLRPAGGGAGVGAVPGCGARGCGACHAVLQVPPSVRICLRVCVLVWLAVCPPRRV